MNKLIAVLIAGAFVIAPVAAMAQGTAGKGVGGPDQTPPIPVNQVELKEEALMKRADYAKLTPEEKAAYKKGMAAQRQMDLQEQQSKAQDNPPTTKAQQDAINAQKNAPKAVTSPAQRQQDLKQQEKAIGGGG